MTDDRAVRIVLEYAALITAVRKFIDDEKHLDGCRWRLCVALATIDRKVTT